MNPNIDAKTLSQISTEKKKINLVYSKTFRFASYIKKSKFLILKCLSVHIGSQILDFRPYEKTLKVLQKIINKVKFKFEYVDLGGGMGINYEKNNKKLNLKKYASVIKKFIEKNNCNIIFEPGRTIVANAGYLISKVIYIKEGDKKNFIILDAAMNDLMRPALYNAIHQIIPAKKD